MKIPIVFIVSEQILYHFNLDRKIIGAMVLLHILFLDYVDTEKVILVTDAVVKYFNVKYSITFTWDSTGVNASEACRYSSIF